jgi:LPPG:FO 2-phospho-L-lactate transferase
VTAVTLLAGGFGGAKMSHGFALLGPERAVEMSIVVNTGDDMELHGLSISPDLDTVMYTLAGLANADTGWGVRDETWSAAEMLATYGAPTWFRLGDRDLATHLVRTGGLRAGARLTEVTARLCEALGVEARLLPMTDERVRTHVRTAAGWLEFQEWFVGRRHADPALEIRFDGIEQAQSTPEVLRAIGAADLLVVAPSNPFVSVGTILTVPGIQDALLATPAPVVAVSPIVGGAALRGPADRMFESLGGEASALGVARHYVERYPELLDVMVIDRLDADSAPDIEALGLRVQVAQTVMKTDAHRAALAEAMLERLVA